MRSARSTSRRSPRIAILALFAALALVAAACGDSDDGDSAATTGGDTATTATAGGDTGEERSINVAIVGNPQMEDIASLTPEFFTADSGIEVNYTILEEQTLREIRSDAMLMNVVVDEGTVHLWGMVDQPETRAAMIAAAEACEGVKRVEGHFSRVPTWA